MFCLALSLFFTQPAPFELPKAEGFVYEGTNGINRLEDRFQPVDLWTYRAVDGRWDDGERAFVLCTLDTLPPALTVTESLTREKYEAERVPAQWKKLEHLARMVETLSPVEPAAPDDYERMHTLPRGYRRVLYCQGTNTSTIVCAFLPEAEHPVWRLAVWQLAPEDVFEDQRKVFEDEFLEKLAWKDLPSEAGKRTLSTQSKGSSRKKSVLPNERALLRADVRHGVAAYARWHVSESEEFSIVDDLVARGVVETITNEMPVLRQRYAAVMPTPVDGTNVLAVARIFNDEADYLAAAGPDMAWSAAYWNPQRRELVAHMPKGGAVELVRTFRHEAFHQYLSYATGLTSVSPWLNEGYAEYFEDESSLAWGFPMDADRVDQLGETLPALFQMDYCQFYAGTDEERLIKYRLAWSVAVFIEKGAPLVRFQPFKNLKRDYIANLLKTRDMRAATDSAFGSSDRVAQFVTEWKRFWKNH